MGLEAQRMFFDSIKEDRGWYFVEYSPPNPSFRFSTLELVVPTAAPHQEIALAMERELSEWTERFLLPVMASAFDRNGDLYDLTDVREAKHLIGFRERKSGELKAFWRLVKDDELPADALDIGHLRNVLQGVGYKTDAELRTEAETQGHKNRVAWWIVFAWAVIGPTAFAVAEWSSELLGTVVLVYSVWKAFVLAMKLSGKWKKSPRELEKEREELAMRHHHYHCLRNPAAFQRLKAENFARWEREKIEQDAEALHRAKGD